MANIYVTRKPVCYGGRLGRECAIAECIIDVPKLRQEFNVIYDSDTQADIWADLVKEFATEKGLKIVSETPIMMIKDNHYDVNIEYRIIW